MKLSKNLLTFTLLLNTLNFVHNFCDVTENKDTSYNSDAFLYKGKLEDCSCSPANVCVRKCCDLNYIMEGKECSANDSIEFEVDVYENTELIVNDSLGFRYVSGLMPCSETSGYYRLEPKQFPEDEFYLQADGRLWQPNVDSFIEKDRYCLEYFDDVGISALACFPEGARMARKITALGMIISMPFLLATFLVYALLPERNIHGKSLMCYVITLFGAYLFLVIIQVHIKQLNDAACTTLGMFCVFFFMVSFFWMNVMSLDIWWTFSGTRRNFLGNKRETERRRFLLYSAYAWGVPLVFTLLVVTLNEVSSFEAWYNPGMGDEQCWFRPGVQTLLYFYGPMMILIITNMTLFGRTAWKIRQLKQGTSMLRSDENKRHGQDKDKQRFNLYLKLLLAMGLNWSMEIISWLVDWQVGPAPPLVWTLTDLCNALYGVFIFFIFVFKWNIWKLLTRRYYVVTGRVHLASAATRSSETPATNTTSLCSR